MEWGIYMRVHPEWPERVICDRKKGEGSAWEAGPRELQLGFGKEHPTEFYIVGPLTQIEDSELGELHHLRLQVACQRRTEAGLSPGP